MPSTGTPSSSSAGSSGGAPSSYTEAGPPDRITPLGRRRSTSSRPTWWGSSSENTPHSRTRRAISWEYCPPKSRTTTSSLMGRVASSGGASREARTVSVDTYRSGRRLGAHAHTLLALQVLALGLERRRHRQLGPVELGDVPIAAGGHRGAQRAHQVERPVVLPGRASDDLLERPVEGGRH